MPSNDDLIPPFDDFDDQLPPPIEPAEQTPPKLSKKSKKKGRKYAKSKPDDEEEPPPVPSVTPSPPAQHGVPLPDNPVFPCESDGLDASPPACYDTKAVPAHQPGVLSEAEPPSPPEPVFPPTQHSSPARAIARPAYLDASPVKPSDNDAGNRRQSSQAAPHPYSPPQSLLKPHSPRQPPASTPSLFSKMSEPPPPHMAQPHFFGPPDIGLTLGLKERGRETVPGSNGYCCRYDSMADAGDVPSAKKARDILLVGWEGGLEVCRVLSDKFEIIGRLEGLRGGVMDAKVLPHVDRADKRGALRPLVAVVVHGPMAAGKRDSGLGREETEEPEAAFTRRYQTTVEIYSLQTLQHVSTLYTSLPVDAGKPALGVTVPPPPPVGDFTIDARGRFIIAASGKSGEIFVFSDAGATGRHADYRCVGKLWTSVQNHQAANRARNPNGAEPVSLPYSETQPQKRQALFSLGTRWLAIVPPASSYGLSVQGSPLLADDVESVPGFVNHGAPSQPAITCETAGVDTEGALSRWTRQAAQGFWKASQIGIENAKYGWREFTNPSPPTSTQHNRGGSRDRDMFPPTNAPADDPNRSHRYPALVSIIDLERVLEAEQIEAKHIPTPLITFAIPDGCNHVSFSPNGLRLLTSNRSGENFRVWDLTNAVYNHQNLSDYSGGKEPYVTQVILITRNSPSVALDSTWSRDGDWLAIVSAHGTVHLHEVPRHPPKKSQRRRSTIVAISPEKAEPLVGVSQGLSPPSSNGFLGGFRSSWQSVTSQVSTFRNQATPSALGIPRTFNEFRETAAAASNAGGRAMARGLSQGYVAAKGGASDLWHADDNKLKPRQLAEFARYGCIKWLYRRSGTSIAIVCDGNVHLYPVQIATRQKGDVEIRGLKADKYAHVNFLLPAITKGMGIEAFKDGMQDECGQQGSHGFWTLKRQEAQKSGSAATVARVTPASHVNEVETNPPYCPFHVDRRVNIFAYEDNAHVWLHNGHGNDRHSTWLFGDDLPPSTKMNDVSHNSESDIFDEGDDEEDEEPERAAENVQSKLTVRSSGSGSKGDRIRVHTQLTDRRVDGRFRTDASRSTADGEFQLLEEDGAMT
ncbi:hypothetical protein K431DRAFT_64189 [Polychaeton citri CBS 116435]|uniref:WD40 repeat-like protein n=1 Tax=Polychaeton citri CBS 116435 TaxID=1314669 RepID=A0A9P4UQG9_9PEZI|nr:hypothetical protein K431DRAFT_64189 [Polychaeton citri CBS 116435]